MSGPGGRGLTASGAARLAIAWRCHGDPAASPRTRPAGGVPSGGSGRAFGSTRFELSSQQLARFQEVFTELSKGRSWISVGEMVTLLHTVGRPLPVSFVDELVQTAVEGEDRPETSCRLRRQLPYEVARRLYEWALLPGAVSYTPPGPLATGAAVAVHLAIGSAVDEYAEEACSGEAGEPLESRPASSQFAAMPSERGSSAGAVVVTSAIGCALDCLAADLDGVESGDALASRPQTVPEALAVAGAGVAVQQAIGSALDGLATDLAGAEEGEFVGSRPLTGRSAGQRSVAAASDVSAPCAPPRRQHPPQAPPVTSLATTPVSAAAVADLYRPPRFQDHRFRAFASGLVALDRKSDAAAAVRRQRWVKSDMACPNFGATLMLSKVAVAADGGESRLEGHDVPAESVGCPVQVTARAGKEALESSRQASRPSATPREGPAVSAGRSLMTVPPSTPRGVPLVKRAGDSRLKTWLQGGGGAPPKSLDGICQKSGSALTADILRPPAFDSTRFKHLSKGLIALEPRRDQQVERERRDWIKNTPLRPLTEPYAEQPASPSPSPRPQVVEKLAVAPTFPRPQLGSSRHKEYISGLVAATHRSHARQTEEMLTRLRTLGATRASSEREEAAQVVS